MAQMRDYTKISEKYAEDVVRGKIPACKWVIKACQRSISDRQRASTPGFRFRYDPLAANRVCAFVERLPHLKGELAGQLIHLEPGHVFILAEAFGWLSSGGHREGKRRFRRVYIEVPRGNGKSCLASGVALYMLAGDGEGGAEVYSAATTRQQAGIVFNDSRAMVRSPATQKLMRALGVECLAHAITVERTNSKFSALSAEGSSLEGLNIHAAVVDELMAHKQRDVWDVLITGAGKRPQSIIWAITTAGFDFSGVGFEQHDYLTKILNKAADDESVFGCIWTIDEGDDWQDPNVWQKANPNWGISVDADYITGLAREAMTMTAKQAGFLTKHLDVWVTNSLSWANIEAWQRCRDQDMPTLEDLQGERCYMGCDLATKNDMAAKVLLFPRRTNGKTHYYVYPTYYLPEAAINDGRNASYKGWEREGRIRTTEGNTLDFDLIEEDILQDMRKFDVVEIGIDPYEARPLVQRVMAKGAPIFEIGQSVANLSEPTKELDALTLSNRFHYDCPILLWMASNVIVRVDTNDNIKPNKAKPENKIDGVIATILALARCMLAPEETGEPFADGLFYV
jgi:phage terminase large subunit-like protein